MKKINFGVQSFCFREVRDNKKVAEMVKEIGVDSIEVCGIHADFSNPEEWQDIVETYNQAGVEIASIGVQTFDKNADPNMENARKWFQCAEIAGCKHISAHFKIDSFHETVPLTAELCEEFGIRVGIHCHGGYMFGGSPDALKHLTRLGAPHIGLCLDTAWCMQIGPKQGNPVQWIEDFSESLTGIHFKDFTFNSDGSWNDVVVGTGTLDLPAVLATLDKVDFNGMAVIEYEGDPSDPVPTLRHCVSKMRELGA
jgi:sugar phosphate isomerase/epimerase